MGGDVHLAAGLLILGVNQGASNLVTAAAAVFFLNFAWFCWKAGQAGLRS